MKEIIKDLEKLDYRADEIDVIKNAKIVQSTNIELKKIIRENNLTALSAPMIGVPYRMFVVKFNDVLRCFINPMIEKAEGLTLSRETCECFPDKEYIRPRNTNIRVIFMTPLGKVESVQLAGKAAIVFQHQIDHLDGLFLSDVGLEIDEDFDKATESEREEIINMYLDSLDIKRQNLQKEIEEDQELNQVTKAIDFMTAVQKGEVEIEYIKENKESDLIENEHPSSKEDK